MRRPRILVLTKTTAMGGAERLLMNALPYLDREQFEYRFAALDQQFKRRVRQTQTSDREHGMPERDLQAVSVNPSGVRSALGTFERLLREIRFDEQRDDLWCLGDFVNRGPESAASLRLWNDLGGRGVLGNHDVYALLAGSGAWKR